jgi:selenocysteine-specific elongation factor
MKVLGTAGHVDHGKSALVKALTGINPDRLREEQEREMTIDLGFAWMKLPNGEPVGIIDVPGHIDFIDNMLAGVGGIDAAVLVVAADEGVMPQTREHLAILDLLDVGSGLVAITKTDLVSDPAWLELVTDEVRQMLFGTTLEEVPILPVSALTGEGLGDLRQALQDILEHTPQRMDLGRPRLSVDRAFTIAGFGTVVTGTLVDGSFTVGEEVRILPGGLKSRIRGLQTHKTKLEQAAPGSRVAINLSGVDAGQIERGVVVVRPNTYRASRRLDVRFRLLPDAKRPVKHNQTAKLYHGAAQRTARIRLLGMDELEPGEKAWLQLELDAPIVASRGDHFILRRPSPGATLGGGIVADPATERRYKRFDERVLGRLERILEGTPGEKVAAALYGAGPVWGDEAEAELEITRSELGEGLSELRKEDALVEVGTGTPSRKNQTLLLDRTTYVDLQQQVESILGEYHTRFPLRFGMPAQELRSRLQRDPRKLAAILEFMVSNGKLIRKSDRYLRTDFEPRLSADDRGKVASLLRVFETDPYSTPSVKQVNEQIGEEVLGYLLSSRQLIQIGQDVLLTPDAFEKMESGIREMLVRNGTITVAEVRDLFHTSRKYALAVLEYLDAEGITIREGDERRLRA